MDIQFEGIIKSFSKKILCREHDCFTLMIEGIRTCNIVCT